ncbi:hypothetical protein PN499_24990 [Kamptonema animale CS-326]|nr:hypothetical protein [Kamptonema animale]MDB9514461.1 hypothetical protein [Kamptonema animale CS-326]
MSPDSSLPRNFNAIASIGIVKNIAVSDATKGGFEGFLSLKPYF